MPTLIGMLPWQIIEESWPGDEDAVDLIESAYREEQIDGLGIQYIQPGKPNQNAYIERFNRTYREELLDQHLFLSLADVREATYWWMIEYNEERPHDALGDLTPIEARHQAARNSSLELSR